MDACVFSTAPSSFSFFDWRAVDAQFLLSLAVMIRFFSMFFSFASIINCSMNQL